MLCIKKCKGLIKISIIIKILNKNFFIRTKTIEWIKTNSKSSDLLEDAVFHEF